ncbi:protease Do-like 5, chloroplastic isoform X1 [Dendrobium catenatum]|uniref:protease Do-like 5, chloroplastic isoform X1 n=1 Tax=Dendrobium catenatum TaxID=906689 RepID=UPI0009F45C64|nr:protease Do-like 5, chloroplastic isoform X1 [Dendrobium catenatum]
MLASFQFPAFPRANATATTRPRISAVLCSASCSSPPTNKRFNFPLPTRRAALLLASSLTSSLLQFLPQCQFAKAVETDEPQEEDERVVRIFQEASPAVVYIKYLEVQSRAGKNKESKFINDSVKGEDEEDLGDAKVESTGSGFVWDKAGHIVTNYHVVAKLATDTSGLHHCRVFLEGSNGRTFVREGRLVGFDPAYDLAVLKVDIERDKLRPALIGTSQDLRVGQNCFAIGNPYGYEHTLTTGVVSGLRREIPSPNGRAIRGAIQTDAAINAGIWAANTAGFEQDKGNSGGPLIDSYGHVIGVNTATFTRKGSGVSSGVNFAIPIDAVVRIIPSLIVNGTDIKDRF